MRRVEAGGWWSLTRRGGGGSRPRGAVAVKGSAGVGGCGGRAASGSATAAHLSDGARAMRICALACVRAAELS